MDQSRGYNRVMRKLLHIAGGLFAFALPHGPIWPWIAVSVIGVLISFLIKPSQFRILRSLSKPRDRHQGRITGARSYFGVLFLLGLLWLVLRFLEVPGAVGYVMLGWLAMAWGDGLAGLIGPSPSKTRTVPWNPHKTWWGFAACIIGVCLAWFVCAPYVSTALPPASPQFWWIGAVLGLAGAVGESMHLRLDDNAVVGLSVPLLALALLSLGI